MGIVRDRICCLFEFESRLDELDPLWEDVRIELERRAHLDDTTLSNFRLALTEAVVNAIVHGHGEDGRVMTVEVVLESGHLEARIHDSGPGFILTERDLGQLDVLAESGRGLALLQHLARDVRYAQAPLDNEMSFVLALDWPATQDLS